MRKALLANTMLVTLASAGLFNDVLKGLLSSGERSISQFVKGIPKDLLYELENDEQQAGQFVCEVLDGNVPGAFEDLATNVASDVWDDMQSGFSDITSFISAIPTLAPQILDNIVSDSENAVSVVKELFTNPGGVLTLIEGGSETVISDIESIATGIWGEITCLVEECTTAPNPVAVLTSSCNKVMAAATTTYSPTEKATTSSTRTAQMTRTAPPTAARQTSTAKASAKSTTEINPAATTSFTTSLTTRAQGSTQTVSEGSDNGDTIPSNNGVQIFQFQTWIMFLTCFVILISAF